MTITQEQLKEVLHYDPETGVFTWIVKINHQSRVEIGSKAGGVTNRGYISINIAGKKHSAHRLVWLYCYGRFPFNIDHIDGCRVNNKLNNLRECSKAENAQNRKQSTSGSSGVIGVSFDRTTGMWRARIKINGKTKFIGRYKTIDEAHSAYKNAKKIIHKFNPTLRDTFLKAA